MHPESQSKLLNNAVLQGTKVYMFLASNLFEVCLRRIKPVQMQQNNYMTISNSFVLQMDVGLNDRGLLITMVGATEGG